MPLILKILLLLIISTFHIKQINCNNELCWNNENDCNIKTELFKNLELSHGISMQIDCRRFNLEENNNEQEQQDHLKKDVEENDFKTSTKNRFMGVQAVMLDGCQTPLNTLTYGLEFLPICTNITKASLRHFHMDILRPLQCSEENAQLQLEYLNIQFNEISTIDADSFGLNYPQLRDVLIEKNSLKLIHKDAFKTIRSLENLYIVNEPVLMLKFPDLFEYTSVASVHLEALKQMTSGIFNHLPETLQNLYVANTPLDNDAVLLRNSLVLRNLTIKNCALQNFTLHDDHPTVKRIDLSGNVMKTFTAYENNLTELNLSNNQLEYIPLEWTKNLSNLERLVLTGNHIKFVHLDNLLRSLSNIQIFDLSENRLQSLQGYDNNIEDVILSQVRLKCDLNPWDCLWLHEFAHYHPEKFRILQYEKYISKINVNGLQCIPADKTPTSADPQKTNNVTQTDNTAIIPDHFLNVSTYTLVYGSPWEFKRNQRAEALIIVFMLPLGIAFLFLLLYMWIYCQKMFHLSYYKGFSCMQTPANHPSQRFDVVRQLPTLPIQTETRRPLTQITDENEMGYEVPLNGIISECNCVMQHNDETAAKCQKSVHITYEQLPTEEPPSQIYEEITEVDNKPTYDHISFK